MPDDVIRVLSVTEYDFQKLGANGTQEVFIGRRIDASPYTEGVVLMRLHSTDWTGSSAQKVDVIVVQDGYTDEDPSYQFLGTGEIAKATVTEGSQSAGDMVTANFDTSTTPLTPAIAVKLKATQIQADTAFKVSLSVDLVMRR